MSLDRSAKRVCSGGGASTERCVHSDLRLAAGSGLVLVVVLLAALLLTRPDPVDAAKPVYQLGSARQSSASIGSPSSGVPVDQQSQILDSGGRLTVSDPRTVAGRSTLEASFLDGNDLGVIIGAIFLLLLAGLVISRSQGAHHRWGCQCGERPLVRTGIPNNPRPVVTARSVVPPGRL